jgi:hypothetical protein
MRLSDAGARRRQTKPVYPDHRLPPWPNEDATPRSLEPIVSCHQHSKRSDRAAKAPPVNRAMRTTREASPPAGQLCDHVEKRIQGKAPYHQPVRSSFRRVSASHHPHHVLPGESAARQLPSPKRWLGHLVGPRRATHPGRMCGSAERFPWQLTLRLSDAWVRRYQTKMLYPNHRSTPWLTEDATPRSLEPIVRRR